MADIRHLRTPNSGETHGDMAEVTSKLPMVDLTSLAPENQQSVSQVTEGWKEGTVNTDTAQPTSIATVRDVIQKIHGTIIIVLY